QRDDVRGRASAAPPTAIGTPVGAPDRQHSIRFTFSAGRREVGRASGHGHDRKTRRVGRARQYDSRRACGLWRSEPGISDYRSQMVLLGAHVRCFSGAGPGAGRIVVLFGATLDAGRTPQWILLATA